MSRLAAIVVDLGFGDSGKGTLTDWLVRHYQADWVVRYNGGAQAGHTVVEGDRRHTFAQFGAGTFSPGVRTFLSRHMQIHPPGLLREAEVLASKGVPDALQRLRVDPQALLLSPFHQAAGRLREVLRGPLRHGSCGLGIGETMADALDHPEDALRAADLTSPQSMRRKLSAQQNRQWSRFAAQRRWLQASPEGARELAVLESSQLAQQWVELCTSLAQRLELGPFPNQARSLVLEGAQGVLLDEWRGFHPHTTWSTCTLDNALELLHDWPDPILKLAVLRCYATRHGAGPLPTESAELQLDEPDNPYGPWQGAFRVGWPDAVLARYASRCCGPLDGLALTHLDRLQGSWKLATAYRQCSDLPLGPLRDLDHQQRLTQMLQRAQPQYRQLPASQLPEALAEQLQLPLLWQSHGPEAGHKRQVNLGLWPKHQAYGRRGKEVPRVGRQGLSQPG